MQRRNVIIIGTVVGGIVLIVVLSTLVLVICIKVTGKCCTTKMTEKTKQVRMQEIGKTVRYMVNKGLSDEERKDYLDFMKENMIYVRKKATSRVAADGDDEKQSFIDFLDEMQIPCSVTSTNV